MTTTIMAVSMHAPSDNPDYGETAVKLRIVDEASGPFFELESPDGQKVRLDMDEITEIARQAEILWKQWPHE